MQDLDPGKSDSQSNEGVWPALSNRLLVPLIDQLLTHVARQELTYRQPVCWTNGNDVRSVNRQKGGNIITHIIIWANQKTESFEFPWLQALAIFDIMLFSRICCNIGCHFKCSVNTLNVIIYICFFNHALLQVAFLLNKIFFCGLVHVCTQFVQLLSNSFIDEKIMNICLYNDLCHINFLAMGF